MERLGFGQDGLVYATDQESVLKCLRHERLYQNERNVYQRLAQLGCEEIAGFNVPKLINSDDELWIVEIQILTPPFVLNFAGASPDQPSRIFVEMSEDDQLEWMETRIEMYGEEWPLVETLLAQLWGYKIFLTDVKPGDISLRSLAINTIPNRATKNAVSAA